MRKLIATRRRSSTLGRGTLELLSPNNHRILAFVRRHEREILLAVFNLGASAQAAILDLSDFEGHVPIELFGGTLFPRVGRGEYVLTLGPHGFYWFQLRSF
jgi:maltose alpha-D-glucosyltransferase / alpha-amylase